MKLRTSRLKYLMRRIDIEAGTASCLFAPQDTLSRNMDLETLGRLCAEAWHDDLPEADRAWAEAHREKFGRWVDDSRPDAIRPRVDAGSLQSLPGRFDKEPAPPWPMLLEAVKSAFFTFVVDFGQTVAGEGEGATGDPAARLHRTSLWRALTADDAPEVDRPSALRAFQRGFRRGRRGLPRSMTRPIPPMLDAPRFWTFSLPPLPGPSAARDRALWDALHHTTALQESAVLLQELRDLYASAWRDDVPEEDREWAESYRHACMNEVNGRRRDAVAQSAYEGYLQSSDGLFNGEPAGPWPNLRRYDSDPWRALVDAVEGAPEGESELATAEAAAREFWDSLYREAPPWGSDPAKTHWLAAVHAARRKALADDVPPDKGS
ncbi:MULTISPECIES: hypothetical protein [Sorangium]|uniref:Uncharacterized protein n=1 Tax=Sorangium cellulosum TaxID=56 RepID=A0A4P2R2F4_SORCE|nr:MULTISPECIES: hypothetical protein [Sorangium]AUX36828.1 hypothetical protein SOCE836_090450 [Sorangium cellulosum]WCQ96123.1 hypothetical protein NQZ70_08907 [Sorangium sp. Soce836]